MPDDTTPPEQSKPTPHSEQTTARPSPAPAHNGAPPPSKLKRIVRPLAILIIILLAGFLFWRFFLRKPDVPPNIIQVTGRVEGDDAAVSAKTAGRIREINV